MDWLRLHHRHQEFSFFLVDFDFSLSCHKTQHHPFFFPRCNNHTREKEIVPEKMNRFIWNHTKTIVREQAYRAHLLGGPSKSLRSRGFSYLASSASNNAQQEFERRRVYEIHYHQLRFRRHDRSSAFSKPRPPTRKKRRAYNRRKKREADERARHSAPGSKAGPRRQWAQDRWQQLLSYDKESDELLPAKQEDEEYTYEDAILEDLMTNTSYLTSQPTPEPVYLGHRHRE